MERISGNDPNSQKRQAVVTRVSAIDTGRARRYLREVESLVREAQRTRDPRVIAITLRVIARQGEMVQELFGIA